MNANLKIMVLVLVRQVVVQARAGQQLDDALAVLARQQHQRVSCDAAVVARRGGARGGVFFYFCQHVDKLSYIEPSWWGVCHTDQPSMQPHFSFLCDS